MNLFELLRTAFKLLASQFTQNSLIIIGLSVTLLMVAWASLSLIFNSTVWFSRNCNNMIRFLKDNTITRDNYSAFIDEFKKFPNEMRFAWKQYENKKTGCASDYLKRYDCLDAPLLGGIQKQNRSLMRTVIYFMLGCLTLFSIAIIGAETGAGTSNAVLTTTMLADAMIVPLIIFLLLMANYYIYTNIRNQEYRTACDYFQDLVDVLSERVDLASIFGDDTRSIGLLSSVYTNETLEYLNMEARQRKNNRQVSEVRIGKGNINPLNGGVLGAESANKLNDNVIDTTTETVSNKLSTPENDIALDTSLDSNFKIKNEVHFVEVVNCVEVLLNRIETETNKVKKQAIEREVNTLIKALTDYKQKAKKSSKKAKTETK